MMKNPFQRLSIRNKLFFSHFLILLVTVTIIYVTITVNNKRSAVEFLLDKTEDIRIKVQQQNEAKQDFLLNERLNEDFFRTGNSEAISRYRMILRQIDENIAQINQQKLTNKQALNEQIITITKDIHTQDELFVQMIDSVKQLGFGKLGLIGSLQNYTQELKSNNLINPSILEELKQQEINYFLQKDKQAAERFDTIAAQAMKTYVNSPSTLLILGSYKRNFARIVALERIIGHTKETGLSNELAEQSKKTDLQIKITIDTIKRIYQEDLQVLNYIFIGLIAVTFIVGILMSYVLAVEITKPIVRLNNAIKEVVATQFKEDINPRFIDPYREDEIGELTKNFNLSIRKIRRSISIIQNKNNILSLKNTELINNQESLRKTNSQKDKFLSIISHDMRAPLSSIISFLDYYKENFNSFTETEIEFVSTNLNIHVKKVVEMLDGLLLWSRSQTGEVHASLEPIDLAKSINDTTDILRQSATNKKITINTKLHNQLVWADKNMTAFIIRNVLSNAIKFTKEGGHIEIYTMRNKRNAFIIIKDTGLGISTENLEKLFRDDVTFSTFGTDNEKGIGLGLVLCKDFMNMQNGSIEIESILNEGTTVNLLFPLVGRD
ncbi:MAG: sensor histidine kinase [Sphingobacteriia bacterium]|nr:MAG: sensor histidine kinase [Sphingobacteriia bacterium]